MILNSVNCIIMIAVMAAVTQRMYAYKVKWWTIVKTLALHGRIYPLFLIFTNGVYPWYALLRICLLINIISLIPNIAYHNIAVYATPFVWLSLFFIIKKADEYKRTYHT